jgi:hypothetical protein
MVLLISHLTSANLGETKLPNVAVALPYHPNLTSRMMYEEQTPFISAPAPVPLSSPIKSFHELCCS